MPEVNITIPWNKALLKNNSYGISRKSHWPFYVKKETKEVQDAIYWMIKTKNQFFEDKTKTWVSIMVYKKNHSSGDCINFIDRLCDSIKKAIKVDDRYFSLSIVDWQIDKNNPRIEIKVIQ